MYTTSNGSLPHYKVHSQMDAGSVYPYYWSSSAAPYAQAQNGSGTIYRRPVAKKKSKSSLTNGIIIILLLLTAGAAIAALVLSVIVYIRQKDMRSTAFRG